ncbi:hypothetical protein BKA67DRAFT_570349 [Truncatella angustata]|uniref:Uncharacterized protein n=1 Tax=Truncatella angustata TaxID=152316 RepID=A0A9P8UK31_9PEZI|nr:uncharacterized protein BKA67DRAFT_570349 [Truncatella angustata]KAH6653572.1 hypothetical protein BKA67DRAFT_570349 [Truncatella angustata]
MEKQQLEVPVQNVIRRTTDRSFIWWIRAERTAGYLRQNRNYDIDLPILGESFDRYRLLVKYQPPLLPIATLLVIQCLWGIRDSLARSFLRYVAELSEILLGPERSFTGIWLALVPLDKTQIGCSLSAMLSAYLETIGAHVQTSHVKIPRQILLLSGSNDF